MVSLSSAPGYKAPATEKKQLISVLEPEKVKAAEPKQPTYIGGAPTERKILGVDTGYSSYVETPMQAAERILPQMSDEEKRQLAAITAAKTATSGASIVQSVSSMITGDYSAGAQAAKQELATQLELKEKPAQYYAGSAWDIATQGVGAPLVALAGGAGVTAVATKIASKAPAAALAASKLSPVATKAAAGLAVGMEAAKVKGMAEQKMPVTQIAGEVVTDIGKGYLFVKGAKMAEPTGPSKFVEVGRITQSSPSEAEVQSVAKLTTPAKAQYLIKTEGVAKLPAEEGGTASISARSTTFTMKGRQIQAADITGVSKKLAENKGMNMELYGGKARVDINPRISEQLKISAAEQPITGKMLGQVQYTKLTKFDASLGSRGFSIVKPIEEGFISISDIKTGGKEAIGVSKFFVGSREPAYDVSFLPPRSGPAITATRPAVGSVASAIQASTRGAARGVELAEKAFVGGAVAPGAAAVISAPRIQIASPKATLTDTTTARKPSFSSPAALEAAWIEKPDYATAQGQARFGGKSTEASRIIAGDATATSQRGFQAEAQRGGQFTAPRVGLLTGTTEGQIPRQRMSSLLDVTTAPRMGQLTRPVQVQRTKQRAITMPRQVRAPAWATPSVPAIPRIAFPVVKWPSRGREAPSWAVPRARPRMKRRRPTWSSVGARMFKQFTGLPDVVMTGVQKRRFTVASPAGRVLEFVSGRKARFRR